MNRCLGSFAPSVFRRPAKHSEARPRLSTLPAGVSTQARLPHRR